MDLCTICSRGHADAEIEAVFAKYDVDGDRILDEDECKKMQEDLEGQKVNWCYLCIATAQIIQLDPYLLRYMKTKQCPTCRKNV